MGMRVISFKTFESNDEFEQWQKGYFDREKRTPMITQVQPIINSLEGTVTEESRDKQEMGMSTTCGCFCLYMTELEPKKVD